MHETLRRDARLLTEVLSDARDGAIEFLDGLDRRAPAAKLAPFERERLIDKGVGASAAIAAFRARYEAMLSGAVGPRYWAFIPGGVTPAALAGDWLASAYDQFAQKLGDTAAPYIEAEAIGFLKDLLGLPDAFAGGFVTGGTMANFVGLAIGRQRAGGKAGLNIAEQGAHAAPPIHVLSAAAHSSVAKALSMLGLGRASLEAIPQLPGREAINTQALDRRLREIGDAPIIVVANAGTVNSVDFDDLDALANLRDGYGFHLHIDAAFGAFAACSPKFRHLTKGMERADTIAADCHKWLNVPYDSGAYFTRHTGDQTETFKNAAAYLPSPEIDPINFLHLTPENSRRLRALPAWMTLKAYGRDGYRDIVETSCALAAEFGRRIGETDRFRLFVPVRLNVACFQYLAGGKPASDAATKVFVARVNAGGRLRLGPSTLFGEPVIRAAFVNWRTQEKDLDIAFEALAAAA
jgi:glutamate/tyrosine decarboxylase-like PLP-dependent enzyme